MVSRREREPQRRLDGADQDRTIEGLAQIIDGACCEYLRADDRIIASRDDDDWHPAAGQLALNIQTAGAGHQDVEDHTVWPVRRGRRQRVQKRIAAGKHDRLYASRFQQALDRPSDRLFVVDYCCSRSAITHMAFSDISGDVTTTIALTKPSGLAWKPK